jgi:hypothetical protein
MEEESLLSFLRTTDRAQPRHLLLAMSEGRKRRVLDEQVPPGLAQLVLDQTAMTGLDGVGGEFAPVERA